MLDTRDLHDKAATYWYDPRLLVAQTQMRAEAEYLLDSATSDAHAPGIDAEYGIVEGQPADGILAAAAARKASSDRHRDARTARFARLFVGSTIEGVLRATEIPMFVVRADHKHAEGKPATGRLGHDGLRSFPSLSLEALRKRLWRRARHACGSSGIRPS